MDKDGRGAVCQGLFKKETDLTPFLGMKVGRPIPVLADWDGGAFAFAWRFSMQGAVLPYL